MDFGKQVLDRLESKWDATNLTALVDQHGGEVVLETVERLKGVDPKHLKDPAGFFRYHLQFFLLCQELKYRWEIIDPEVIIGKFGYALVRYVSRLLTRIDVAALNRPSGYFIRRLESEAATTKEDQIEALKRENAALRVAGHAAFRTKDSGIDPEWVRWEGYFIGRRVPQPQLGGFQLAKEARRVWKVNRVEQLIQQYGEEAIRLTLESLHDTDPKVAHSPSGLFISRLRNISGRQTIPR